MAGFPDSCNDAIFSAQATGNEAEERINCIVFGPHSSPDGFDSLASDWNSLLKKSPSNTIFLTREWLSTWWRLLGHGELWILAFYERCSDELVGIAPLYRFRNTEGPDAGCYQFSLVGCLEVADYLDMIIARGWERPVYDRLLCWLQSADAPMWELLDLCNLPEISTSWQLLPDRFAQAGLAVKTFQEDVAPLFQLPSRYEYYLSEVVDKKQRHEIRRKQRRAERAAEIGFHIVGREACLEADVDDFVALQRASDPDKARFMTAEMHRFFAGLATKLMDLDMLRLCFLTVNDERAAALYAFEYDGSFMLYNSGYDPELYAELSPGWVLLGYCIQYAIACGCHTFDFMQGDEEYKYRFGCKETRVMRVVARKRRTRPT